MMSLMHEGISPNRSYYRAVHGRWSTNLEFVLTDLGAFWATRMSFLDRARLLSMTILPRLLGPLRLDTSVDCESRIAHREVLHTTRVSKLGMTLVSSVETFTLDEDGRRFQMRGEMRLFPNPWQTRGFGEAYGEIDASGTQASYRFAWFGTEMRQRGEIGADGDTVTITQETPFSRGVQVLRRASAR